MFIAAVDPGTTESGICWLSGTNVFSCEIHKNEYLLQVLAQVPSAMLAIETMESYGKPVGQETFVTCIWIGRFIQAHALTGESHRLIKRSEVKRHVCKTNRASDSDIRTALISRFGTPGKKAAPGRTYGLKSHMWSALAIGVTALETPGIAITPRGDRVNVWPKP